MHLPHFEGWRLIGQFPLDDPSGVGSWLLVHAGEAALLEVPEGLTVTAVKSALKSAGVKLRWATASHDHWDHLDEEVWKRLQKSFPKVQFHHPESLQDDCLLEIGGEPAWLIRAPKHSLTDVVTVFRGVAMTGDIELGTLNSVTDEVSLSTRRRSMARLRGFQDRTGYHVHSIISAHLNDVRTSVRWPDLFTYPEEKRTQCRSYGCWGKLVPMERDSVGRDMKCEDCGCPDWSDTWKV